MNFGIYILLILIILTMLDFCAILVEYNKKTVSFNRIFFFIIYLITIISFQFAAIYNSLYILTPNTFKNVEQGSYIIQVFEFFYYSIGIFTTNSVSSIEACTFVSKLATLFESILMFVLLILIIGNLKDVGKAFKDHISYN